MTARFTLDPPLASAALNDVPPTPNEMAAVTFVKELAAHVDEKNGKSATRATQKKVAAMVRERFFSPLASANTWAGRRKAPPQHDAHCANRAREWLAAGMEAEQRSSEKAAASWLTRQPTRLAYDQDCPDCGASPTSTSVFGFACEHTSCPMFTRRVRPTTDIDRGSPGDPLPGETLQQWAARARAGGWKQYRGAL